VWLGWSDIRDAGLSSEACDYSVELPHWSYCSWFDVCWSFGVDAVLIRPRWREVAVQVV